MIHDPAQTTHLITVAQKEMDTVMKEKARAAREKAEKNPIGDVAVGIGSHSLAGESPKGRFSPREAPSSAATR